MSAFVVTKKNSDFWDLPVLYAGQFGEEEVLMVFTSRHRAARFIEHAQWLSDHQVSELSSMELFEIIFEAHKQGVGYLAVNPDQKRHLAGEKQPVIALTQQVANSAESLTRDVLATALKNSLAESALGTNRPSRFVYEVN